MTERKELATVILDWAASQTDEAVLDPRKGYYPFEVIADAFEKGAEHAEKSLKEQVRRQFFNNAKLTSRTAAQLIAQLRKEGFSPNHLYVRLNIDSASVLLTIDESTYLTDEFLTKAYELSSDIKTELYEQGLNFEIAFLNHEQTLDVDSLRCNGYEIDLDLNDQSDS